LNRPSTKGHCSARKSRCPFVEWAAPKVQYMHSLPPQHSLTEYVGRRSFECANWTSAMTRCQHHPLPHRHHPLPLRHHRHRPRESVAAVHACTSASVGERSLRSDSCGTGLGETPPPPGERRASHGRAARIWAANFCEAESSHHLKPRYFHYADAALRTGRAAGQRRADVTMAAM
jgi:hypothetical protein